MWVSSPGLHLQDTMSEECSLLEIKQLPNRNSGATAPDILSTRRLLVETLIFSFGLESAMRVNYYVMLHKRIAA